MTDPHANGEKILILDFGSQYTQVIARRVRECNVYSEIIPFTTHASAIAKLKPAGIILSGGPASVYAPKAPQVDTKIYDLGIPVLGICYGMQLIAHGLGGKVERSEQREYGPGKLKGDRACELFHKLPATLDVWNSHGDKITKLPRGFCALGRTENSPHAVIGDTKRKIFGLQFHPEVVHTPRGKDILANFVHRICGCRSSWTMESFIDRTCRELREQVGDGTVILGNEFIKVFEAAARDLKKKSPGGYKFLAQGTLYPDVIESVSISGNPAALIKSHHNVGGLPERMKFELVEPLRQLFKDEVRRVGAELGLSKEIVQRQPFPGPGLAVRILGEITPERLRIVRDADSIVLEEMKASGWYYKVWQSFAVLLPVRSVGVMGDERTYDYVNGRFG